MKRSGDFYFLLFIMALVLGMIVLALRLDYIVAKLLPLIIGSIVLVLAVIALANMRKTGEDHQLVAVDASADESKRGLRAYLPMGIWVVGFWAAIYVLGFMIAIPIFVLAYMKSHGISWATAVISTVFTTAIVYAGFEMALRVQLYRGLLFTWLSA